MTEPAKIRKWLLIINRCSNTDSSFDGKIPGMPLKRSILVVYLCSCLFFELECIVLVCL